MTAYNPPLFSFGGLKFNKLIYEVADTVASSIATIVNLFSITTNQILTFDVNQLRELWTDSSISAIYIGSTTATMHVGSFDFFGNDIRSQNPSLTLNVFGGTTEEIRIGQDVITGNNLVLGNHNCTLELGKVLLLGDDILYYDQTVPVSLLKDSEVINIGNDSQVISIGTTQLATGNINIGSTVSTILCGPNFRFQGSALTSAAVGSAMSLFNNIVSGSGTFFNGLTTGSLSIMSAMTTGFCNIGGTSVSTGGLRLYNPITMGYAALLTPTANQIGYIKAGTFFSSATSLTPRILANIELGVGVWILKARAWLNVGIAQYVVISISSTGATDTANATVLTGTVGRNAGECIKYLTITSGTLIQNYITESDGPRNLINPSFQAIRIA